MKAKDLTAKNANLISCSTCHLLCRMTKDKKNTAMICPRCGASLHSRKPASLSRTWAFLLAACIFYIPANVLPITTVTSLGEPQSDTIMSSVIYFIHTGMWPIALVIFTASILIPLLKLLILIYLLISVQQGWVKRREDRTRLYRITEAVGRWSMVDIYVVTILVALVNLGSLASVQAEPGVVFFGAVVVITMFAAMSFDPRLIWDEKKSAENRENE